MKRSLVIFALILAHEASADVTQGGRTVDCYCTDKSGGRVELGEYSCLRVDGRIFTAQCQMSLNVPMWREITNGCLSSSLDQSIQPSVDTSPIHAQI